MKVVLEISLTSINKKSDQPESSLVLRYVARSNYEWDPVGVLGLGAVCSVARAAHHCSVCP